MAVQPNWRRFLASLGDEVRSQSTRIRDLIGDAHWYYDGHHKEYLLTSALARHLPAGIIASRGFLISAFDVNHRSAEQDVLIVDTHVEAPLFFEGGVIVALPDSVIAAISVKTRLGDNEISDSVKGLNSVRDVVADRGDPRRVWCAAYCFEAAEAIARNPSLTYKHLKKAIAEHPPLRPIMHSEQPHPRGPDLVCTADDLAFRLDYGLATEPNSVSPGAINGFACDGLGTAFFLTHLLSHVHSMRGNPESGFASLTSKFECQRLTPPHVTF